MNENNFTSFEDILDSELRQDSCASSNEEASKDNVQWTNFFVPTKFTPLSDGHLPAKTLEEKIRTHIGTEAHHGVFDLEPRSTFKDYSGKTRPALRLIPFDFDSEEDKGARALTDAIAFIQFLNVDDYALFFSGKKGFVVGVPEGYIGLEHDSSLPVHLSRLSKTLKINFPTLDTSIYTAAHKLRAFGTRHPDSGLFKVLFPESDRHKILSGRLHLDEIRKLASEGRGLLTLEHLHLFDKRRPLPQLEKLFKFADNSEKQETDQPNESFKVDSEAVKQGCDFLRFAKDNPNALSEQQWYASLSILGRLENGREVAHEYSKEYRSYIKEETDQKLDHALSSSKPRTCKNITAMWDGCKTCKYWGIVNSPISIRSNDFLVSTKEGFHFHGKPCYKSLLHFFDLKFRHITLSKGRICYSHNGVFYEEITDAQLESFAQEYFRPFAKTHMTKEFRNLALRTNLRSSEWFEKSTLRKMNFLNGVLDIDKMVFNLDHSPDYGFKGVLNFNYDPNAACPIFDKFIKDITGADVSLEKMLLEYMGYAISNDHCDAEKILVLTGDGSNGKTRFLNILRALGGKGCISLSPSDLKSSFKRQLLDGALFCIMEELPPFSDAVFWEDMKGLASGKSLTVEKKLKDPYEIVNKTKIIQTCNELPGGTTPTHGFLRKLLIVPFNQVFSEEAGNRIENIDRVIIESEMSGVMNRALAAYARLRKQKYIFTESTSAKEALQGYRTDIDNVLRWYNESVCVLPLGQKPPVPIPTGHPWLRQGKDLEYFAVVPDMYQAYKTWCELEGEKPVTATRFTRRLKRLIPECGERMAERKISGKKLNSIRWVSYYCEPVEL